MRRAAVLAGWLMRERLADQTPAWPCNPTATLRVNGQGSILPRNFSMKKIIALTLVAASLVVSGCNTISGVGRDVSAVGSAVAAGAEDAKN